MTIRTKVILDYNVGDTSKEEMALRAAGVELVKAFWTNEDDHVRVCSDPGVVALVVGPIAQITRRVIEAAPNLKIISRIGIGFNNIDTAVATARNIPVSLVLDYCTTEVADHAMAFILAFARKLVPLDRAVKGDRWGDVPKVRAPMLRLGKATLGIVGTGRIGGTLAARAKAFGMRVIAFDPYLPADAALKMGVELVSFDTLLAQSDFISLHAPLTKETTRMFNLASFRKMKRTAFLVNNARGGLVDEQALATALTEGLLAGAGLDVTDSEPPPRDSPLLKLDNVFLTGHASWYSEEAVAELRWKGVSTVIEFLRGNWPANLANPEVRPSKTI